MTTNTFPCVTKENKGAQKFLKETGTLFSFRTHDNLLLFERFCGTKPMDVASAIVLTCL
jgi:hypothetical protein